MLKMKEQWSDDILAKYIHTQQKNCLRRTRGYEGSSTFRKYAHERVNVSVCEKAEEQASFCYVLSRDRMSKESCSCL